MYFYRFLAGETLLEKTQKAKDGLFYSQGTGHLYLVCQKTAQKAIVEGEIKVRVDPYLPGYELDKLMKADDVRMVEVPIERTYRSPYTALRAINQGVSTQMYRGTVTL